MTGQRTQQREGCNAFAVTVQLINPFGWSSVRAAAKRSVCVFVVQFQSVCVRFANPRANIDDGQRGWRRKFCGDCVNSVRFRRQNRCSWCPRRALENLWCLCLCSLRITTTACSCSLSNIKHHKSVGNDSRAFRQHLHKTHARNTHVRNGDTKLECLCVSKIYERRRPSDADKKHALNAVRCVRRELIN